MKIIIKKLIQHKKLILKLMIRTIQGLALAHVITSEVFNIVPVNQVEIWINNEVTRLPYNTGSL